jgi:membrane protease YdiL (CAAX protease family)
MGRLQRRDDHTAARTRLLHGLRPSTDHRIVGGRAPGPSPDGAAALAPRGRPAFAFAAAGCLLLAARPVLLRPGGPPSGIVLLFGVLLVGSLQARLPAGTARTTRATALLLGCAAFAAGRLLGGATGAPGQATATVVALNSLAAVAEEAFFRRFLYAALLPAGAGVAVVGSATLFAAVHVTVYGAWVLPLDLAAGLLFSWQRWATGSWAVPAVTHVWANLLAVI